MISDKTRLGGIIDENFHHPHDTLVSSAIAVGIVIATVVFGVPRILWLLKGATIENEST
jgi:hypothetical protein